MNRRRIVGLTVLLLVALMAFACAGSRNPALQPYREAVKSAPKDASAWDELGREAMKIREWKEARTAFKRLVALRSQDAEAWFLLGVAECNLGQQMWGEERWKTALEIDSLHVGANRARGTLELDRIVMFERAAEDTYFGPLPGSQLSVLQFAFIATWEIQDVNAWYSEVLEIWKRMVTLEPEMALNWANLAMIGNLTGNLAHSRECCLRALALDPGFFQGHGLHADMYASALRLERWRPRLVPPGVREVSR